MQPKYRLTVKKTLVVFNCDYYNIFYRNTQSSNSRANRGRLCNFNIPIKFTMSGSLAVVEEIKLGLLVK